MRTFSSTFDYRALPNPADPDAARLGLENWGDSIRRSSDPDLLARHDCVIADPGGKALLEALFGNSPHLSQAATADPAMVLELMERGPQSVMDRTLAYLAEARLSPPATAALSTMVRTAKRQAAFAIAAADISGLWPGHQVTQALSDLASATLSAVCARLLCDMAEKGAMRLPHPEEPEKGSGLVVLGMGKLGAGELNYSSDIDLILLYDTDVIETDDPDNLQTHFVRMARSLVKLMEERTADGYVFRTDLRLRPDPSSTPPALSVLAAETYYEAMGQNWERAAMIKARPVAGDREAGERFVHSLRPFIWRKSLDFAAIQDIHSIKRQINAHRGGSEIAVAGHNVKLGRGGIREIEFFAQTQQLIWGGRDPSLRIRPTVAALTALAEAGRITQQAAADLTATYWYLRKVEHRIQMVGDQQAHKLPETSSDLRRIAVFLGYPDTAAFAEDFLGHLRRVESYYIDLFEDSPDLSLPGAAQGNLVFTGGENDPDTIETVRALGFSNPQAVCSTIRGWHHGRYRATRSTRARELLTELVPTLLSALSKTTDPDGAFTRFDKFLQALPAGVQLFSMFYSNPALFDLVAEVMGVSEKLAEHLARHPIVLDSVISEDLFAPPSPPEILDEELDRALAQSEDYEETLDAARRWANDKRFQVGIQMLRNVIAPDVAAKALSNVADVVISRLLPRVEQEFARQHGYVPGTGMVVAAMGKLGSREMTPTSDLDLIFVYDIPEGVESSDGPRPISPSQYFARLSQRFINALTAATSEGVLYEVDMRLRPSGNAGPIASSLESFVRYHVESAWTWEHMALTRARVICGPPGLRETVAMVIRDTLCHPRDPEKLLCDVADMRLRMDKEHHADTVWEVKHLRGGLVDIDFMVQYLLLRHAPERPEVLSTDTRTALIRLTEAGFLDRGIADDLLSALELWQTLQGILRLSIEGKLREDREGEVCGGLELALVTATGVPDCGRLEAHIKDTAAKVYAHFQAMIDEPAKRLAPPPDDPVQS